MSIPRPVAAPPAPAAPPLVFDPFADRLKVPIGPLPAFAGRIVRWRIEVRPGVAVQGDVQLDATGAGVADVAAVYVSKLMQQDRAYTVHLSYPPTGETWDASFRFRLLTPEEAKR